MPPQLTKKHERFVAEYLACMDATRAAKSAGYSEKSAQSLGCNLLKHPKVSAEIAKKLGKKLEKLDISAERTLNEIGRCAFLDARKFYHADGRLKAITELDDDTAATLAGMEIEEAYEHFGKGQAKPIGDLKKIKFASKLDALKLLAQYHKLLVERVEVSGLEGLADAISKARARARK